MYRAIARNKWSTVGIFAVFFLILGVLGSIANALYAPRGTYSVLVLVLVGAALYATIQYFLAGRQAISMSGAMPIQRSDDPRLYRIVENLSITTGTPMPAV